MGQFAEDSGQVNGSLFEQVQHLKEKVDHLSARLANLEDNLSGKPLSSQVQQPRLQTAHGHPVEGPPSLIDTKTLLPRIATVCFLLVIALILRTITDNQIINIQAGSVLGMTYAGILILMGWRLYAKTSRLAPIFPGCGILLLFSIILETHGRFESLSTIGAYTILFVAGITVYAMSIRHRASALICLGVPGTLCVALAINFPYSIYPIMCLFLLSAILAASFAYKQQMCRHLRWSVLVISAVFWSLWTLKMGALPGYDATLAAAIYPAWFFPLLFLFWGVYLTTVVLNVLKKDLQLGVFESLLPSVTASGAFLAGHTAIQSMYPGNSIFYGVLVLIATLHLGLAWWLASHDKEKASGSNVFTFAGACLIVLTSATVIKSIGYIIPVWSASGLFLLLLSEYWKNTGIRVTSYLMQATACVVALTSAVITVPTELPVATGLTALCLAVFSLIQYTRSRSHKPEPNHSFFFSRIDRNDYSAVVLLLTGLLGGYFFSQFVLHEILAKTLADFSFQFKSGQSLIINLAAIPVSNRSPIMSISTTVPLTPAAGNKS